MGSSLGIRIYTNYKRDPDVHCLGSLDKADIDSSSSEHRFTRLACECGTRAVLPLYWPHVIQYI